jgi:hypothetical protein
LTYTVGAATKGQVSVVNGKLRYQANAGASGADSFTYRASDGVLQSAPVTVSVTIAVAAPTALDVSVDAMLVVPAARRSSGLLVMSGSLAAPPQTRLRCGDDITVTVGPLVETVPGHRFLNLWGLCVYVRHPRNGGAIDAVTIDLGRGRWAVAGTPGAALSAVVQKPLTVGLGVGTVRGTTTVALKRHGDAWTYTAARRG